jgi:hypothetical protein
MCLIAITRAVSTLHVSALRSLRRVTLHTRPARVVLVTQARSTLRMPVTIGTVTG